MRFIRLYLLQTLILSTVAFLAAGLVMPVEAFAQAVPPAVPAPLAPPTLSTATVVATVLSLLLGIVTQMVQTGTFLGKWITPKSWLPGLTIVMTLLGGIVSYLASQSPLVLNSATIFYAVVAGIVSLMTGAAPGLAVHAHVVVPANVRAIRLARMAPSSVGLAVAGARGFGRVRLLQGIAIAGIVGMCLAPVTRQHAVEPRVVQVAEGCGFMNSSGGGQTATSATAIGSCVLLQYLSGVTNIDSIIQACDNVAAAQIVSILDSLIGYYTQPATAGDAGAALASPMICGVGAPPVLGAPTCVTQTVLGGIKTLRTSAATRVAAAGH